MNGLRAKLLRPGVAGAALLVALSGCHVSRVETVVTPPVGAIEVEVDGRTFMLHHVGVEGDRMWGWERRAIGDSVRRELPARRRVRRFSGARTTLFVLGTLGGLFTISWGVSGRVLY